jgi:hypothetical protein
MLKMCDAILKTERRRCLDNGRKHKDEGCRPGLNICG